MKPGLEHRVYTVALVVLMLLAATRAAAAQVDLSVEPAMTLGSPAAPVTIVEFSDFQ